MGCHKMVCFVLLWFFGAGVGTQGLHLERLHQPFFVKGFF
jgi:hypothetical protein